MKHLTSKLTNILLMLVFMAITISTGAAAYTVEVEPDHPPAGRSLFDHMFARNSDPQAGHEIPFPFERLLSTIAAESQADDERFGFRTVRIPLGRGLHAQAAGANYFSSPTIVAGMDAPVSVTSEYSSLQLRDRLFFSYQPRSQTLEVISYNEDAGRFEFQIVRDYGPSLTPRVYYARRVLCVSCHHNGGPIFSAPVYQETDVNALIASRLHDETGDDSGFVDLTAGMDNAYAIAASASRTEKLPAWQRLWREACEADDTLDKAIKCRSVVYLLGLQYRLSGFRGFDRAGTRYQRDVVPVVVRQASTRWPDGLLIPSSRIADRAPLFEPVLRDSLLTPIETRAVAPMQLHQDPLTPRRPAAFWRFTSERDVERLIEGVGQMIPLQHARELENVLETLAKLRDFRLETRTSDCDVSVARRFAKFTCGSQTTGAVDDFDMVVSVYLDKGQVTGATVGELKLAGENWRSGLDLSTPSIKKTTDGWQMTSRIVQPFTGLNARRSNGVRLAKLTLTWTDTGTADDTGPPSTARASLLLVNDFELVVQAIDQLEGGARSGEHDLFTSQTFRPAKLQRALITTMTAKSPGSCCDDPSRWPAIELDPVGSLTQTTVSELLAQAVPIDAFVALCAGCHQFPSGHPPAFLLGSSSAVRRQIEECAQRIWMRVRMLGLPPSERPLSPMPPLTFALWHGNEKASKHLHLLDKLEGYVEGVVRRQLAPQGDLDELLAKGYQDAAQCRSQN